MTDPSDRPGVLVLPPLLYLGVLVAGFTLNALLPVTLPVPAAVRWAGGGLIIAGIVFGGAARAAFAKARTHANPMRPATAIVSSGVFRLSRNPMYVGMSVASVGLALLFRVGWLLILLAPALAIMHWGVVLREERYLARKFAAEYEAYRARVRRYF